MRLSDWMKGRHLSDADLARLVGRDRSIITKLRAGKIMPSVEVLAAIERLSDGKVTAQDFLVSSRGFAEDPPPPLNPPDPSAGATTLTIAGLDPITLSRLKAKAELAGRTVEEVARDILDRGAILTPRERLAIADRIRAMTPPGPPIDVVALIREDRDTR